MLSINYIYISVVIAKTASRNVAFKAAKIAESAFAGQSETLTRQLATVDALTEDNCGLSVISVANVHVTLTLILQSIRDK